MLIEFTVTNFRSIKESQTLSMLASSIKEHPDNVFDSPDPNIKLLKTAVIYGANASGKSNLVDAFEVFGQFITKQNILPENEILAYEPFLLEKKNKESPITFEIEFFNGKIRYNYKISFSKSQIEFESLYHYPKGKKAKLFEREANSIDFGDSLKGLKGTIAQQLLPNQVFLNKAANNNNEHLKLVFLQLFWMLRIPFRDFHSLLNGVSVLLLDDKSDLHNKLSKLLIESDTGLSGFKVRFRNGENNLDPFKDESFMAYLSNYSPYEIKWINQSFEGNQAKEKIEFSFDQGSLGTQKLFGLGGYIVNAMESLTSVSIIIDELNNSFHPLMTEAIIKLFHNKETNPNNSQLIFTTHDASILKNELFRRDQVWFTEKDYYGATSLFSLAEFDSKEVRKNIPFDKWYLSGRFGAIPMIADFNYKTLKNEGEKVK